MKWDTLQAGPTEPHLRRQVSSPAITFYNAEKLLQIQRIVARCTGGAIAQPAGTCRGMKGVSSMTKMKANVFEGVNRIAIKLKEVPKPGYNEALVRVTLTTICGTDLHILKGEYPVKAGLTIGHEPVGVIEEIGPGITGYKTGERVLIWRNHTVRPVRILPFRQV